MTNDDSYPFRIPTWTPSQGAPEMTDAQALDYLCFVLGASDWPEDHASQRGLSE